MAYIEKRANGTYRVRVRRRGYATQTATFSTLSDAKKWAYITEGDVLADRHFPSTVSKKHDCFRPDCSAMFVTFFHGKVRHLSTFKAYSLRGGINR